MAVVSPQHYTKSWYLALLLACFMVQLFLTSAPIFGFSSILILFKKNNFYKSLCKSQQTNSSYYGMNETVSSTVENILTTCAEQDKALNLLFVIGIIFHSGVKFTVGCIVDKIGAQICQYIGCVFILSFSFSLAYAKEGHEYLVILSFIFLSFGSSFLMLTCYQVANIMFKKNKSLFLCILSGSVDSSTAVFILFLVLCEKGLSFTAVTSGFGTVTVVFVILTTSFLYPSLEEMNTIIDDDVKRLLKVETKSDEDLVRFSQELSASYHGGVTSSFTAYKKSIQKNLLEASAEERLNDFSVSLSRSMGFSYDASDFESSIESVKSTQELPWTKKGPYGVITEHQPGYGSDEYGRSSHFEGSEITAENIPLVKKSTEEYFKKVNTDSLWTHIFSKLNMLCVFYFTIVYIRLLYFIGNLDKYFDNVTDKATGTTYVRYFGFTQFVGVLIGPLAGLLFTRQSKAVTEEQLKIENIRNLILPGVILTSNVLLLTILQLCEQLYLSIPIFLLYLSANGLMWCFSTTFYGLLFPPQFFCSMYGFVMVISGLLSFLQYPILYMEQEYFHGDQFWTNLMFLVLCTTTIVLPIYLFYLVRFLSKKEQMKYSHEEYNVGA